MRYSPNRKLGVLLFFAALTLVIAVACGSSATSTPASAPTSAATTSVPQATVAATAVPTTAPSGAAPTGTLNIGFKELFSFGNSPRLGESAIIVFVGNTSGETLLKLNIDKEIIPQMVTEWTLDDAGTVWTLKLQEGIQFHKGYGEMTAEDVKFTMEEYASPEGIGSLQGVMERLYAQPGGGVSVIDDYTLEVDTVTPQFDFQYFMIVPEVVSTISKKLFEEQGDAAADKLGIGTGPWEFVEQSTREFWKFQAVEDHYRKAPEFAELVLWDIPEEATRVANFETGKLDSFLMAFDSKPRLDTLPDIRYMSVPNGSTAHIGLHPNHYVGMGEADFEERRPGAFNCLANDECPWVSPNPDVNSPEWERARKVREALLISVNRQEVVDTLLGGEGSPQSLWAWENRQRELLPAYRSWEFNPDRAQELLAEAGYSDGFDIEITASIRGVAAEAESCEAVAEYWEDIGLNTNINRVPYLSIGPRLQAREYVGLSCHGTGGRVDPATIYDIVYSSESGFSAGFDHPTFQGLMEEMFTIADDAGHWAIMNELAAFMYDNALDSGFYSVNVLWPLGPKVNSWRDHLQQGDTRSLGSYEYATHRDQ